MPPPKDSTKENRANEKPAAASAAVGSQVRDVNKNKGVQEQYRWREKRKRTKSCSEQQSDGVATSDEVRAAAEGRCALGCCRP